MSGASLSPSELASVRALLAGGRRSEGLSKCGDDVGASPASAVAVRLPDGRVLTGGAAAAYALAQKLGGGAQAGEVRKALQALTRRVERLEARLAAYEEP